MPDHYFTLTTGDASGDGHRETYVELVRSSLSRDEVVAAYRRGCTVLGFDMVSDLCVEHEDRRVGAETVTAFMRTGFDATDDKGEGWSVWADQWTLMYLHVCRLGAPDLQIEVVPDDARNIVIGGYGVVG